MSDFAPEARLLARRGFLKGSALFAAAAGLAVALPAAAQNQAPPVPAEKTDPAEPTEPKTGEQPKKKALLDEQGREYRVCEICGANMYKDGRTWSCEQCGLTYEE